MFPDGLWKGGTPDLILRVSCPFQRLSLSLLENIHKRLLDLGNSHGIGFSMTFEELD